MRRRFDDVVIVDWSSASVPTGARPRKDAVCMAATARMPMAKMVRRSCCTSPRKRRLEMLW